MAGKLRNLKNVWTVDAIKFHNINRNGAEN